MLGLLVALGLPVRSTAGRSLSGTSAALASERLDPGELYVVRPGDTLWSIAVRMDPSGDPRPLVEQMAQEVQGDTVVAGERLRLP
ncbi:MAG: LysM peptidoglycan-binding domain-containing protein [Acidimicrobiales bacterium]